jgi:hypothetical protein
LGTLLPIIARNLAHERY